MAPDWLIRTARVDELQAAFQLIFGSFEEDERALRVRNCVDMTLRGELQRAGIFIAVGSSGIHGALICLPVPGASALIWPPAAGSGAERPMVEDALVARATSWLRNQGIRLAQALMEPADSPLALPLLRNGFQRPTALEYLRHQLRSIPDEAEVTLHYQTYRQADRAVFHGTLERTYEGTLDCPELNGLRTLEEIVTGHLSQGAHDPDRWWLAFQNEVPVGVLLLTEISEWQGWDLSYLGVVREARKQKIGQALTRKALIETKRARQAQLTLALDERNTLARGLYAKMGFGRYDRRDVYLALWPARTSGHTLSEQQAVDRIPEDAGGQYGETK
jgi:mycothiol synthase